MNRVILSGNLARDPELRTTANGLSVARFTVAVNRRYRNAQGERGCDFIKCSAWRQTAEFVAKWFKKGKSILVEGAIQTWKTDDQQTGEARWYTEVVADNVEFAGNKSDSAPAKSGRPEVPAPSAGIPDDFEPLSDDADLPF